MADPVVQYLAQYAEPEIRRAPAIAGGRDHVVVVPACDEAPALLERLVHHVDRARGLTIVVVNAPAAADPAVLATNQTLLAAFADRTGDSLHLIDRTSPGQRLPPGEGVGLARKIGCDLALALWADGKVASPWIHSTDADAILPDDYLDAPARAPADAVALTYRFGHDTDASTLGRAMALYEASLRYYVLGLAWAGSPYAFHSLGSCLAVGARAYATVRGVPRREAGEDFYLLGKLAKIGAVARAEAGPVRLALRRSRRVPFGTGPAIERIAAGLEDDRPLAVYHPDCFVVVRDCIAAFDRGELPAGERAAAALAVLGGERAVLQARAATTTERARRRRLHQWLDALRTLRVVHHARDAGLGTLPIDDAVRAAPFCPDDAAALAAAEETLAAARGVDRHVDAPHPEA